VPKKISTVELCAACTNVSADERRQPLHVVHPITEELLRYDLRGLAVCPACRAVWRRVGNKAKLEE